MDDALIARIQGDLIDWGILERERVEVTRRFRGAIMRAAIELQEQEKSGRRPEGHAVRRAVELALRSYPLPPGAVATPDHESFVIATEVASLPEAVRNFLGV